MAMIRTHKTPTELLLKLTADITLIYVQTKTLDHGKLFADCKFIKQTGLQNSQNQTLLTDNNVSGEN